MVSFNSNNYSITWTKINYDFDIETVEIIVEYYVNNVKTGNVDTPDLINLNPTGNSITTATLAPYMFDIDFTQTIKLEISARVSGQFTNSMYPESWGPREVVDEPVYYTFSGDGSVGSFSNLSCKAAGDEYQVSFKFDFNDNIKNLTNICLQEAGIDQGSCTMFCSVLNTQDIEQHKDNLIDYTGQGIYTSTIEGNISFPTPPAYITAKTHYIMIGLNFSETPYIPDTMVYSGLIQVDGTGTQVVQLSYGDDSWRNVACYIYDGTEFRPIMFNSLD